MSLVIVSALVLMAVVNSEILSLLMLLVGAVCVLGRFFLAVADHGQF